MTIRVGTITYATFCAYVRASVPRFRSQWLNKDQEAAVSAPLTPPMFIVAGPGTGKTTVLALRVLKLVLVDGLSPDSILATTFTRKAASELRSRILSWGVAVLAEALKQARLAGDKPTELWLQNLDINAIRTGTLDSLAEDMITDDRQPGEITPAVIESFLARGLLRRNAMYTNGRHKDPVLDRHLKSFNPKFPGVYGFTEKIKVSHSFASRALHDSIDLSAYSAAGPGYKMLADLVEDYHQYLTSANLMDFALLEAEVLRRLRGGRLTTTLDSLRAILVDEFQDTNYLQEQIYYELCSRSGASLTVVGDDDQSIYRFRSATVEVFSAFAARISTTLGPSWTPTRINLTDNYRSTERIVSLCNHFITAEPDFQPSRAPGKLPCIPSAPGAADPARNLPVLGLFRSNVVDLATDLSDLLGGIFRRGGYTLSCGGGTKFTIQPGPGSDFGDAVLLAWKVSEVKDNGDIRLPGLMSQNLQTLYGVDTFNPRGRELTAIPEVIWCLGSMLECIDPNRRVQNSITYWRKQQTPATLNSWRVEARQFAATNPNPGGLQKFLDDWGLRLARNMSMWPKEWPLLDLMFTLVTWMPLFQRSPEGQIYLEAIGRTIAEAAQMSQYNSAVLSGTPYDDSATKELLREVFEPIAEGDAEIDEDIMPYVPRSSFPIMTVHQAKGLEFPLVIVDVGSDFRTNHASQRPHRYPNDGGNEHYTEDHIAPYTPVGQARLRRTRAQRAFDDIRRLYYVAKSRSRNVLILAGLTTQLGQLPQVLSVATGDLCSGSRAYSFVPAANWTPGAAADCIALI